MLTASSPRSSAYPYSLTLTFPTKPKRDMPKVPPHVARFYGLHLRSTPPPPGIRGRLFHRAATPESPSPSRSVPADGKLGEFAASGTDSPIRDMPLDSLTEVLSRRFEQELHVSEQPSDVDMDTTDVQDIVLPTSQLHEADNGIIDEEMVDASDETNSPSSEDQTAIWQAEGNIGLTTPASVVEAESSCPKPDVELRRGTRIRRVPRRILENTLDSPIRLARRSPDARASAHLGRSGRKPGPCAISTEWRQRWKASTKECREARETIQALRLEITRLERSENRLKDQLHREKERLKDTRVDVEESRAALILKEEELDEAKVSKEAIKRELNRFRGWWLTENHSVRAILTLVPKCKRDAGLEAIVGSSESRFKTYSGIDND
ncbi:hypothetical protein NMY22_g8864 [Coprinellus aureogranulatus]|nr:hypothetical protein NMY22_g8864 [Coprinellus aureogranulatus]